MLGHKKSKQTLKEDKDKEEGGGGGAGGEEDDQLMKIPKVQRGQRQRLP